MHMNDTNTTTHSLDAEEVIFPLGTLTAITCAFIIHFATLGNLGIIILIRSSDRLFNSTGIFIISMTTADLGVGILSSPIFFICAIRQEWIFGSLLCSVNGFFNLVLCEISLLSLTGVSLDRFWAICKPMEYHRTLTNTRAILLVIAIWLISILFAILPLVGVSEYKLTPAQYGCIIDWGESLAFSATLFAVCAASPFTIMIFVYYNIFRVARMHIRGINARVATTGDHTSSTKKEMRTLLVIVAILGVYIVCWAPYFVVTALNHFLPEGQVPDAAVTSTAFMAFSNSAIQPYIYGITNSEFRRVFFKKLLRLSLKYRAGENHQVRSWFDLHRVSPMREEDELNSVT